MLPASDANASVLIRTASWRAKEEKMNKYIVKAYDGDKLYGYATIHPEEKELPFYTHKKEEAILFDSKEMAEKYIEKCDSSKLEHFITKE
jgi:hypothetical protein